MNCCIAFSVKASRRVIQTLVLLLSIGFMGFGLQAQDSVNMKPTLSFDHVVIFVNSKGLEEALNDGVFTPADKLETDHGSQGTYGRYYLFLNTFIELLYLRDAEVSRANHERFGSAYTERWRADQRHCPFAFGLSLNPFDTSRSEQRFHTYRNVDAGENDYYLMPLENQSSEQPMLYVSTPYRNYKALESMDQIDQKVEEHIREDLRNYLKHPAGIERLTQVLLTVPRDYALEGNLKTLEDLENVQIISGDNYELTLVFDEHRQGKEVLFDEGVVVTLQY